MQEGGIEPDIEVPQLTDPDYKGRKFIREADLRRHLINQTGVETSCSRTTTSPIRASPATAEELKKKGIKDFQLYYALKTLKRLAVGRRRRAAAPAKKPR